MSPVQVRPAAFKDLDKVHLTVEEKRLLEGEGGEGPAKAMELLVALGDIYGADKLIPIESAQIAGVSYKTMGDGGLEFIEDFSKTAKVKVKSMLNPAGMDLNNPTGESEEFSEKQTRLIEAYASMGIEVSCTCTPYLAGNRPKKGEHLAWSESSAVSFANSVLGAMTNREGGPSALMAAVIGKTPRYGLHIPENRTPDIVYEVEDDPPMALLGHLVGESAADRVPYFRGISPTEDELKSLGAAMAATGSVAMYHVENVTPEAKGYETDGLEKITITSDEINGLKEKLLRDEEPEVVVIGCPHLSQVEIQEIADYLNDKVQKDGPELRIYTSKRVKEMVPKAVKTIERFGKVISDTCMVVSPLEEEFKVSATDSGKAVAYLPKLAKQRVIYLDRRSLLELIA